jgi:two-component system LytT family response regulator
MPERHVPEGGRSGLRVVVADDERPARRFLTGLLGQCPGVTVSGEAASGDEALDLIASTKPDLALLDLRMPGCDGFDVVRQLPPALLPLVAFVTAFDDFAVEAFELNAIDYLLKPPDLARVRRTIERAQRRLSDADSAEVRASVLARAAVDCQGAARHSYLDRVPVRLRDEIVLLPVRQIAYLESEAELLHLHTVSKERYTIAHRLHALEGRLDPRRFVRLGRGLVANLEVITRVCPLPGGTMTATLANGVQLSVSRIQARLLRDRVLSI